jgi:hypothetical protein
VGLGGKSDLVPACGREGRLAAREKATRPPEARQIASTGRSGVVPRSLSRAAAMLAHIAIARGVARGQAMNQSRKWPVGGKIHRLRRM